MKEFSKGELVEIIMENKAVKAYFVKLESPETAARPTGTYILGEGQIGLMKRLPADYKKPGTEWLLKFRKYSGKSSPVHAEKGDIVEIRTKLTEGRTGWEKARVIRSWSRGIINPEKAVCYRVETTQRKIPQKY